MLATCSVIRFDNINKKHRNSRSMTCKPTSDVNFHTCEGMGSLSGMTGPWSRLGIGNQLVFNCKPNNTRVHHFLHQLAHTRRQGYWSRVGWVRWNFWQAYILDAHMHNSMLVENSCSAKVDYITPINNKKTLWSKWPKKASGNSSGVVSEHLEMTFLSSQDVSGTL